MGIAKVLYNDLKDTTITDALKDIDQTYLRSLLLSDNNVNRLKEIVGGFSYYYSKTDELVFIIDSNQRHNIFLCKWLMYPINIIYKQVLSDKLNDTMHKYKSIIKRITVYYSYTMSNEFYFMFKYSHSLYNTTIKTLHNYYNDGQQQRMQLYEFLLLMQHKIISKYINDHEASNRYTYPFLFEFKLSNGKYLRYISTYSLNKVKYANDISNLLYFEAVRSFRSTPDGNVPNIHITIPLFKYTSFDNFKESDLLTIMTYYSYTGYVWDYDKIVDI